MGALRREGIRGGLIAAAAVAGALGAHTLIGRIDPAPLILANVFTLAVLVPAFLKGELYGAVLGTVCGLLQDTAGLGVFGVAGLSKTVMGFLTGLVAKKINLVSPLRNYVFFVLMTGLELGLWLFFYVLISGDRAYLANGLLLLQPPVTAALGTAFVSLRRRLSPRSA